MKRALNEDTSVHSHMLIASALQTSFLVYALCWWTNSSSHRQRSLMP